MVRRTSNEKQQERGSWMQHTDARSQDAKPSRTLHATEGESGGRGGMRGAARGTWVLRKGVKKGGRMS